MISTEIIRITSVFNLEMAHRLIGHDGLCKNIHGHSYKLIVSVKGTPVNDDGNPKDGMVMDFSDLKTLIQGKIIDVFDHALILKRSQQSDELKSNLEASGCDKIVMFEKQPTCENILAHIVEILAVALPNKIELARVKIWETGNTCAEWYPSDNSKS